MNESEGSTIMEQPAYPVPETKVSKKHPCAGDCGREMYEFEGSFCATCGAELEAWPPAIRKALVDEFTYAVGLRDGNVISFASATKHGRWIRLSEPCFLRKPAAPKDNRAGYSAPFNFERGVEIMIDDILWAADAPWGS